VFAVTVVLGMTSTFRARSTVIAAACSSGTGG